MYNAQMESKLDISLPILWGRDWNRLTDKEREIAIKAYNMGVKRRLNSSVTEDTDAIVDTVFKTVEVNTGYSREEILGNNRVRSLVEVRFACLGIIRELTSWRNATISRVIGWSPTSTSVRYALEKDYDWMRYDFQYKKMRDELYEAVKERLRETIEL